MAREHNASFARLHALRIRDRFRADLAFKVNTRSKGKKERNPMKRRREVRRGPLHNVLGDEFDRGGDRDENVMKFRGGLTLTYNQATT